MFINIFIWNYLLKFLLLIILYSEISFIFQNFIIINMIFTNIAFDLLLLFFFIINIIF